MGLYNAVAWSPTSARHARPLRTSTRNVYGRGSRTGFRAGRESSTGALSVTALAAQRRIGQSWDVNDIGELEAYRLSIGNTAEPYAGSGELLTAMMLYLYTLVRPAPASAAIPER